MSDSKVEQVLAGTELCICLEVVPHSPNLELAITSIRFKLVQIIHLEDRYLSSLVLGGGADVACLVACVSD